MILALDQATAVSGYAIWNDEELVAFGHYSHDDTEVPIRFHKLCNQIRQLCEQYPIDIIVIEDIQMQAANVATFQKLAQVQGAILETALSLNKSYAISKPTEWRAKCNFLKGQDKHRENQKKVAQTWVQKSFNIKCTQDEADAICIGYAFVQSKNEELNFE